MGESLFPELYHPRSLRRHFSQRNSCEKFAKFHFGTKLSDQVAMLVGAT